MLDTIFKVVWVIGLILASVPRVRYTRLYRQKRIADDRNTGLDIGLDMLLVALPALGMFFIPLLYMLTPWLDFADYRLPTWASLVAGLVGAVTFAVALWLLWRSHADLGRNWSPKLEVMEEHSLVTQGVFRHIRHPMYAAHLLWGIAQAFLLQNWIAGWAFLVSSLPLYLVRIPREEQMMLEHFGDEYREYMSRTGRVIPRP